MGQASGRKLIMDDLNTTEGYDDKECLPSEGQVCENCHPMWDSQNLPPQTFQIVRDEHGEPVTTVNGAVVIACPYCDGLPLFELPKNVHD